MASLKRRAHEMSAAIETQARKEIALPKSAGRRQARMLAAFLRSALSRAIASEDVSREGAAGETLREAENCGETRTAVSGSAEEVAVRMEATPGPARSVARSSRFVSLARRARMLRAEIEAEEAAAAKPRLRPAAVRFFRIMPSLQMVGPARVFEGGRLVAEEPVYSVFSRPAAGEAVTVAKPVRPSGDRSVAVSGDGGTANGAVPVSGGSPAGASVVPSVRAVPVLPAVPPPPPLPKVPVVPTPPALPKRPVAPTESGTAPGTVSEAGNAVRDAAGVSASAASEAGGRSQGAAVSGADDGAVPVSGTTTRSGTTGVRVQERVFEDSPAAGSFVMPTSPAAPAAPETVSENEDKVQESVAASRVAERTEPCPVARGSYSVSLKRRGRVLRAEVEAEEAAASKARLRPAAVRFFRIVPSLRMVGPARVFEDGRLVAEEPVYMVFSRPAAGEAATVAKPGPMWPEARSSRSVSLARRGRVLRAEIAAEEAGGAKARLSPAAVRFFRVVPSLRMVGPAGPVVGEAGVAKSAELSESRGAAVTGAAVFEDGGQEEVSGGSSAGFVSVVAASSVAPAESDAVSGAEADAASDSGEIARDAVGGSPAGSASVVPAIHAAPMLPPIPPPPPAPPKPPVPAKPGAAPVEPDTVSEAGDGVQNAEPPAPDSAKLDDAAGVRQREKAPDKSSPTESASVVPAIHAAPMLPPIPPPPPAPPKPPVPAKPGAAPVEPDAASEAGDSAQDAVASEAMLRSGGTQVLEQEPASKVREQEKHSEETPSTSAPVAPKLPPIPPPPAVSPSPVAPIVPETDIEDSEEPQGTVAGTSAPTAPETERVPASVETVHAPVAPTKADTDTLSPEKASGDAASSAKSDAAESPARKKRRKRWRWRWFAFLVLVLALAGVYAGTAAAVADEVPEGTSVAGVDIGGLHPDDAVEKLERELAPKTRAPFAIVVADSEDSVTIDPVDYALSVDPAATVATVTGFDLRPASVAAHLFGGSALDPVVGFDKGKLARVVQDLQLQVDGGYADATVAFEGATPKVVNAKSGLGLEPDATTAALTVGALGASEPLKLAAAPMSPQVSDAEATEMLETLAKPLVAAPVTMTFNGQEIEATPEVLAEAASFPYVNGASTLEIDGARLAQVILDTNPEGIVDGEDAKIQIVDHERVEITPSTEGIGIDEDKLAADVAAAVADGTRTVTVETAIKEARFTTQDAEAMGIGEIVAEIDTPITWEYLRTLNLEAGAAKTTGTLVKPGETFSLLDALGPIDTAHGFYAAGMIIGGQHKDGVGGGLSQISTNTFNLGYRAGYEDIEHHPHSYYFDRYPMGAESTLAVGAMDMRWRNNTPYGAVIDSWVADGYVHSRLWSTKYWDVDIQTSEPRNIVYAGWNTVVSNDCEYTPKGNNGFTVTVTRTVSRDGENPTTDTNDVTYQPDYGTRCVAP